MYQEISNRKKMKDVQAMMVNLIGQTLGNYYIIRQLGRGAMGMVYEVENEKKQAESQGYVIEKTNKV